MDADRPAPTRRKRIDGTILLGGILSALLHAIGIALLLMTPTRLQPLEQTAYTVEVVDPDALGGELLAGPIGAAPAAEPDEPEPEPEPAPEPEPEPAPEPVPEPEPERIAKTEPPEAEPVAVEQARPTARATPAPKVTARPKPKPTVTKVAKVAKVVKATPVRKPAAKKTASPKRVAAVKKTAPTGTKPAAKKPAKPGAAKPGAASGGSEGEPDLDSRLSAAIAGLEGQGARGGGLGGTADTQKGSPGVGGQGPGGGGQVRGLKFVAYYTKMLARIKGRWTWLGDRSDLQVTVRFSILPSGDIANLRLVERSGDATYDASVQRAIKGASPFAPPPEAYQRDFADVELTFRPADLEVSG